LIAVDCAYNQPKPATCTTCNKAHSVCECTYFHCTTCDKQGSQCTCKSVGEANWVDRPRRPKQEPQKIEPLGCYDYSPAKLGDKINELINKEQS
jgi:hypothetical protein